MRKKILKLSVLMIAILTCVLLCVLIVNAAEEREAPTVSYYYANGRHNETVTITAANGYYKIKGQQSAAESGKTFFGWYSLDGKKYSEGLNEIKESIVIYEAYGMEVTTENELKNALARQNTYIRLGSDITVKESLAITESGLTTIDLNGHSLVINADGNGFECAGASVYFIDTSTGKTGSLTHISKDADPKYMTKSLINYTSKNLYDDVKIKVTNGVKILTNAGFLSIENDVSSLRYNFDVEIKGSLTSDFLLRSNGTKNVKITLAESSSYSTSTPRMLEDISSVEGTMATLVFNGGVHSIAKITIVSNEPERFDVMMTGGSFGSDVSSVFPFAQFTYDSALSKYVYSGCNHSYKVSGITASCTEAGKIYHTCEYCGNVTEKNINALGHSLSKELAKEPVATKEKTEAGYYKTTCLRNGCDYSDEHSIEYIYPEPKDTYVTVKLRNNDGSISEIRVEATRIYGDNVGERLDAFSTLYITERYQVSKEAIISIEIPLGVTTIAGGIGSHATNYKPKGLFYGNTHLEEIVLPMSMKVIEEYAFSNIPTLRNVIGLEYVSDHIKQYAFKQEEDTNLEFGYLEINAYTVDQQAFYNVRMRSLKLGTNVSVIKNKAFGTDGMSVLTELFIGENIDDSLDGQTINDVKNKYNAFSTLDGNQQFTGKNIVYFDHVLKTITTLPTCQTGGYDTVYCVNCDLERIENETDVTNHEYTEYVEVGATCVSDGYKGYKCKTCELVNKTYFIKNDPENPVHDYTYRTGKYVNINDPNENQDICLRDYYVVGVCICGERNKLDMYINGKTPATGQHTFTVVEGTLVEATCGVAGKYKQKCSVCSLEEDVEVKPTGIHKYVVDETKSYKPTCSKPGLNFFKCLNCTKTDSRLVNQLDPDNHTWTEWEITVEPTKDKVGKRQRTCEECQLVEEQGIPTLKDDEALDETGNVVKVQQETSFFDNWYAWVIVIGGSVLALIVILVLLYIFVFRKRSRGYQYKFDSMNRRDD